MLLKNLKSSIIKCKSCNEEKNINDFKKYKNRGEEAIMPKCTVCYLQHIKKFKQYKREHYLKNKDKYNQKSKTYRLEHIEELKEYWKNHRSQNKEQISVKKKQYYQKNKKLINKKNLDSIKMDPKKRILKSLRNRIIKVLRGTSKSDSTVGLLGCSVDELKIYLEKQFYSDISWDNYGSRWHIDHIIPCSSFNLLLEEEQRKCFHYTNMRPLLAEENLTKSNKIIPELMNIVKEIQSETIYN